MSAQPGQTDVQKLGGEAALRAIIDDFVDRVMGDVMIGFHFQSVDPSRLKQLEFEFALAHLGGEKTYTGRPLGQAHGPHRILGGQFNRRLRILEQTLQDHGAPVDVINAWISHNERLRSKITSDLKTECND